ncbi:MAG: hypothetical protein JXK04_01275 [Campylobacterales bacterium]|nr:hypothetical protein [Campylobacterales bacterium]
MHISIRKVFFNLRMMLLFLGAGVFLLTLQLFHISQYGERLGALKNQHLLIEKIISSDMSDPRMAAIHINGAVSEITLSVKLSGEEALFDALINSNEEQASLLRSLSLSSQTFQDNALIWSESSATGADANRERMMNARTAYLSDIDRMVDYQIHIITQSIATAKITALFVFCVGLGVFFFYSHRLRQIYRDIHRVCSVDVHGGKKEAYTREIDYVLKRLARQSGQISAAPNLIHPFSGLNNEKGLIAVLNSKKPGKGGNSVFVCQFEIDGYAERIASLSDEDRGAMVKKIGEIVSLYEQPLDAIGHTEGDRIVFVLTRNAKHTALDECEDIVRLVEASAFPTSRGEMRITLSAGFLLKTPNKNIDESIEDTLKLIEKAKANGGNRVAQLRDKLDVFH